MSMPTRSRYSDAAGYSLVELLVALAVTSVIMGATMVGLTDAVRANDSVMQITGMNNMLRASMDLMVLDLMQAGAGVPTTNRSVGKPSGTGAVPVLLPGPPGSAGSAEFTSAANVPVLTAVRPGQGYGPGINDAETDTISVLVMDANVDAMQLSAITPATHRVDVTAATWNDAYQIGPGQLMLMTKSTGAFLTSLLQVTAVDPANRRITFAPGDSLQLNQTTAQFGSLGALNAAAPAGVGGVRLYRVRLITYYIDAVTNEDRPRLVRRINGGPGTAVGLDIENLQLSYDLLAGGALQSFVEEPGDATQIRKVNITLSARSRNTAAGGQRPYRNTLNAQVSLRGMALTNRYVGPQ